MSNLSSIVELSETNTIEQNSEVLNTVANYTTKLAKFVDNSNVIINDIVSVELKRDLRRHVTLNLTV